MINIAVTTVVNSRRKDLSVSFDPAGAGAQLIAALNRSSEPQASHVSWYVERTGETIEAARPVGEGTVLHGDILVASGAPAAAHLRRAGRLGPETVELRGSRMMLGREPGDGGVVLQDPTVSRQHLIIEGSGQQWIARNLSATSGTIINGTKVEASRPLRDGDLIELGDDTAYTFVQRRVAGPLGGHLLPVNGRLQLNRPPRALREMPRLTVDLGPAPAKPNSRRFPLPMVVLPLVIAVAVAVFAKRPEYLAFGLLGPLMAGWNWADDRRSGRGEYEVGVLSYRSDLTKAVERGTALTRDLAAWNDWAYPSTSDLFARVRSLSDQLWDRQPGHPDFLDVRVGTGDLPAAGRISISERGETALIEEARTRLSSFATERNVPVAVSLLREPVLGIAGGSAQARLGAVTATVLQLGTRNSPSDVTIAVLGSTYWQWTTWLPHTVTSGSSAPLVGTDPASCEAVLARLEQLLQARTAQASAIADAPHLVLVVESPVALSPPRLKSLVSAVSGGAISVIWLAENRQTLPAEASVFLDLGSPAALRRTAGDQSVSLSSVESVPADVATAVARTLAPLVDPSSGAVAAIPDSVGLFDVLGGDVLDRSVILRRWARSGPDELVAPIGVGRAGPVVLNLGNDADGPHGLVAGSTGSGKSEFLQTLVLSLASSYSPDALTFMFIDFKGGLTFRDLVGLPHAVGMACNLDSSLALRAKRSLQAEARRRQQILRNHGAVNLSELRQRAPQDRLPALVIIVDEYAELAQKLPEFLEGLVEIAQTGRALGLHLLLATQSPGQTISKNIQNCVKYRISFRLEDSGESLAVLGRGRDAALLPNHAGRGLLRDGDAQLHEFQAAYAGGRTVLEDTGRASASTMYGSRRGIPGTTSIAKDSERLINAIIAAAQVGAVPPPRRPWVEPLDSVIPLSGVLDTDRLLTARENSSAPIGRIDLPDTQSQPIYDWDLSVNQNLLIVGDGGTGKSSTLRTIAAAFSELNDATELTIIAIDATGGGLTSLNVLPNTVAVVNTSEQSRLRRVLAHLQTIVAERRKVIGAAGSLRTYRQGGGEPIGNVVVLIDGLVQLMNTFETLDAGSHLSGFVQLISDGPAMGMHFAMTTEQPQRIPMSISNTVPERLVLRMASKDVSNAVGLQGIDVASLPDGRAISTHSRAEVQIAVNCEGAALDGLAQAAALRETAQSQRSRGRTEAQRLGDPPDVLTPALMPLPHTFGHVPLGIDDIHLRPLTVDLSAIPTLIVMGPDLSGRSAAIEWVRQTLAEQGPQRLRSIFVSGRGDRPPNEASWTRACATLADATAALETEVASLAEAKTPLLVAIDDGDDLIETPIGGPAEEAQLYRRFATAMDTLVRAGRNAGVIVVLAGRLNALTRVSGWPQRMKQNQQAVILAPATLAVTFTDPVFNVTFPRRSDFVSRPGNGVLIRRGTTDVIQLVHP